MTKSKPATAPGKRRPVGYIRESVEDTSGNLTEAEAKAGQIASIRLLAQRDGLTVDDADIFAADWGYSGAIEKDHLRKGLAAIRNLVANDEVSVIYVRSFDRLGRSSIVLQQDLNLCRAHGTRVVTEREGVIVGDASTPASPGAVFFVQMLASLAEMESNTAKVRAQYANATKVRKIEEHAAVCPSADACGKPRLHVQGCLPYGMAEGDDLDAVLAAFRKAGSYSGAANLLNRSGLRSRLGKTWSATVVGRIVRANGATSKVVKTRRGSTVVGSRLLTGLVRCHCGSTLTPMFFTDRKGCTRKQYICNAARYDPQHPRPYQINESVLVAFLDAKVNAVLGSDEYAALLDARSDAEIERAQIAARRDRIGAAVLDGLISTEEAKRQQALLDARIEELDASAEFVALPLPIVKAQPASTSLVTIAPAPRVDWDAPVGDLNRALRTAISAVVLDRTFKPAAIDWRIKSLAVKAA